MITLPSEKEVKEKRSYVKGAGWPLHQLFHPPIGKNPQASSSSPPWKKRIHVLFRFSNDVDIDLLSLTPRKVEEIPASPLWGKLYVSVHVWVWVKKGLKMGYNVADTAFRCTFEVEQGKKGEKLPLYLNNERKETWGQENFEMNYKSHTRQGFESFRIHEIFQR